VLRENNGVMNPMTAVFTRHNAAGEASSVAVAVGGQIFSRAQKDHSHAHAHPPHPGELLRELWLAPMGLSITAAAGPLGVSRKTLSEVVNGHSAITPEMALRLELAFGKSAQSWLGHQSAFDLWQLQPRAATLGVRRVQAA
jgi:addiction module HigA family antidote